MIANRFLRASVLALLLGVASYQVLAAVPEGERLTEVEQLKLQLALETQKRIQAELTAVQAQTQALVVQLFAAHHKDLSKDRLDIDTFTFTPPAGDAQGSAEKK